MPLASSPSCEQFLEHVSRPGCDGGWLATSASDPSDFAKCDLGPDSPFWREAVCDASRDSQEIRKLARTSQLRKGVPKWEVPAELWRLILHPDKVISRLPLGLGHNRRYECPTEVSSRIIQMLSLIRLHRSVPPLMTASESFNVHRKDSSHLGETNICGDVRTVHAFGPFPKWLYRHLYSSGKDNGCAPHFAFGAVKGRRREGAIASQCILMERCHTRGLSTMMRLYDVRNAFCSVEHDVFDDRLTTHSNADFLSQHIEEHVALVKGSDRDMWVGTGQGAPQGHSIACDLFSDAYNSPVQRYIEHTGAHSHTKVCSAVSGVRIELSSTLFVDDLATLFASYQSDGLWVDVELAGEFLDCQINPLGLVRNKTKDESLPRLVGMGSRAAMSRCMENHVHGSRSAVRYLGLMPTWSCTVTVEIGRRVGLAWKAWYADRSLWHTRVDIDFKVLVFKAIVLSTLLSGLTACVLSDKQYQTLGLFVVGRARVLHRGKACKKTERGWSHKAQVFDQSPGTEALEVHVPQDRAACP